MNDVVALLFGVVLGVVAGALVGRERGRMEGAKAMELEQQHRMR